MTKYILKKDNQVFLNKINYAEELNEEQYRVVTEGEGPCLVLAGAGSGKTRTLTYRVAYLLEQGVKPQNIMLVTFTNKAAREMLLRVELLLGRKPQGLWGGTFHSLGNRVLRRWADKLGYGRNFNILDQEDSKSLLKNVINEMGINTKDRYFPKADLIHSIISFKENSRKTIAEVIKEKYPKIDEFLIKQIENIYRSYCDKKLSANAMDFDDLLTNWHRLLCDFPEVKEKLSGELQYILVDEYQDTNKIQAMIMESLAEIHGNILVVGDDAQSIYSFRAANIDNILGFPKKFPDAKIFKLETNYRSAETILDLANASIGNNSCQFKKNLQPIKEGGSRPTLIPCKDNYEQAEFIAERVLELCDDGRSLRDAAILFRAAYQALELELELNKRGIPYIVRGGIRFFEQAHIKDAVAYLRIFANNKDELSWMRILKLYPGIGQATANKIWQVVSHYSSLDDIVLENILTNIGGSEKCSAGLCQLNSLFRKLLGISDNFIASSIAEILKNYEKHLENSYENWRERWEDVNQLANFAVSYKDLDEFLADVSLSEGFRGERTGGAGENNDDYLILSTIHQAKGLEWDAVFIMHLAEGQFPHYKSYENPRELEEERRLFYVAVTRAKNELYLSFPVISFSYTTGENINRPSMFLREVPEDLFDKWELEGEEEVVEYD